MADSSNKLKTYELTNPMETFPGLTIDDLNRYLPAIRTVEDMSVTIDNMQEGMFLTKCIDGLKQLPDQSIDLIISNPPYISLSEYQKLPKHIINYEPSIALTDNNNGLSFYHRFANQLPLILKPNGMFLCELGSPSVSSEVKKIFLNTGYTFNIFKDLNNNERILQIQLSSND